MIGAQTRVVADNMVGEKWSDSGSWGELGFFVTLPVGHGQNEEPKIVPKFMA